MKSQTFRDWIDIKMNWKILQTQNITVELTDSAKEYLAHFNYEKTKN